MKILTRSGASRYEFYFLLIIVFLFYTIYALTCQISTVFVTYLINEAPNVPKINYLNFGHVNPSEVELQILNFVVNTFSYFRFTPATKTLLSCLQTSNLGTRSGRSSGK
jgi:hypothetical protein